MNTVVFEQAHCLFKNTCNIAEHGEFQFSTRSCHAVCRESIIAEAADSLCSQHTISIVAQPQQQRAFYLAAFLVPKHDAVSSRLILDCRPVNALLRQFPLPRMPLPKVEDLIEAGLKRNFMASRDASSMFYQFPVPDSLAKLLQVRAANRRGKFKVFRFNVLPMGHSIAPSMAQSITLCCEALSCLEYLCERDRRYNSRWSEGALANSTEQDLPGGNTGRICGILEIS